MEPGVCWKTWSRSWRGRNEVTGAGVAGFCPTPFARSAQSEAPVFALSLSSVVGIGLRGALAPGHSSHFSPCRWPRATVATRKNSSACARPRRGGLTWVAVSWADRDLFFRDCGVVAGSGASAGSRRPQGSLEYVMNAQAQPRPAASLARTAAPPAGCAELALARAAVNRRCQPIAPALFTELSEANTGGSSSRQRSCGGRRVRPPVLNPTTSVPSERVYAPSDVCVVVEIGVTGGLGFPLQLRWRELLPPPAAPGSLREPP